MPTFDDAQVEGDVVGDELVDSCGGAAPVEDVAELLEVVRLRHGRGQSGRLGFEQSAYLEQLQGGTPLRDAGGEGQGFEEEVGLQAGDVGAVALPGDPDPHAVSARAASRSELRDSPSWPARTS